MTFAVKIHLASGQTLRGELVDPEIETEEGVVWALKEVLSGAPGWREIAGILVYSQVVSGIEIEQIGESQ